MPTTVPITNAQTNAFLQAADNAAALAALEAIGAASAADIPAAETQSSILGKLQTPEAGETQRIGAEFMPEVIESVLFELATIPEIDILPANTIGVNPAGEPVIGDGITAGGNVISTPSRKRFVGSRKITDVQLDTPLALQLGSFSLPAAKAVVGTKLRMVGEWSIVFDGAVPSTIAFGCGLAGANTTTPPSINVMQHIKPAVIATVGVLSEHWFDFTITLVDVTPTPTTNLIASVDPDIWAGHTVQHFPINEANFGITPTGTPTFTHLPSRMKASPYSTSAAGWNVAKATNQSLGVWFHTPAAAASTGAKLFYNFELVWE